MMGNPSAFSGGASYDATAAGGVGGDLPAQSMQLPSTGLTQVNPNTGLSATSGQGSGLSEPWARSGYAHGPGYDAIQAAAGKSPPTFLDQLLEKGSSMMNNRGFMDFAGRALSGFAAGQQQQAKLAWQEKMIREKRENSRFGEIGSRYNTAGMMGPATYTPQGGH